MIRNFLSKFFHRKRTGRKSLPSPRRYRRITIEPLETRRLLAATGSISGFIYLDPANAGTMTSGDAGFAGMTVELQSVGSSGSTTLVSPGGIATTGTDGSYSFTGVAAGTYQVQITPSPQLDVGTLSPGSAGGTAGTNEIQLTLTAGQAATDYNFALLGANPSYISARMDLATTGTLGNYLSNSVLTPPTVQSTGSNGASGTTYSTSYTAGGTPVNVAPGATINSTESPNLLWLTATIENPVGSGDQLSATIPSGSGLSSNFTNGVLTISGSASAATYQSVLQSITYSSSDSTTVTTSPTITIVASDGTTESAVYTTSIAVAPSSQAGPTITGNPTATTVNAGQNATFTATASGTPTPTVQWEVNTGGGFADVSNGGVYSGATTGTLTITGATATMNGYTYEAVFTNSVGSVTSNSAALTVDSITTQPTGQTVNSGANATFTAATSNSGDAVQWDVNTGSGFAPLSNGGVYSGVATKTLTITGVTASLSGDQYEAIFTNVYGTLTTSAATLTVSAPPVVTTNPTAALAEAGGNATFTAAASGTPTPTVQWEVNTGSGFSDITNGGVYSGATTGTLTITAATAAMNGYTYEAVFTNSAGSATSNTAALTVDSITTQPASQAVNAGQNATFTAASSNSGDTVQWEVNSGNGFILVSNGASNGAIYGGALTGTLTITDVTQNFNGYQYRAVFTNSAGTLTTSPATLTIDTAPVVTTNPTATLAEVGGNTTFTAAASGTPTPTVQWEVNTGSGFADITNGGVYSGATTGTLTITGATAAMNGYTYEAVFTNVAGTATSNTAALTVDSITAQPASQTINAGANTTFTATSSNSGDTVQWMVNAGSGFTALSNAGVYSGVTSTTLTITGATTAMNGDQYEAVFTNSAGTLTSNPATLTVEFAPIVTMNPTAALAEAGGNASFTAMASGSPTPTVQWEVNTGSGFNDIANGGVYSGATTGTLTITGATAAMNDYTYQAVFTNSLGSATTSTAELTVDSITAQPTSQTISAGANTSFTATSSNSGDTVQWVVNAGSGFVNVADGGVYSGATTDTLTITGATPGLNGDLYEAVFTNSAGTLTSSPATLTVDFAPIVSVNPSAEVAEAGGNATFTAMASGNPAPTVQWMVNTGSGFADVSDGPISGGGSYSGATTDSLTITGATTAMNGYQYEAVFTNSLGSATTSAAALTVDSITTQPVAASINAGQNATFTAASSYSGDTVQWEVNSGSGFVNVANGGVYSGATTGTLTITGATAGLNGDQYEAVFTNTGGTLTSNSATLSVDSVMTSPISQTIAAGSNVSFTAASYNSSDTVQWEVNTGSGFTPLSDGGVYSGSTTTTLTITGATAGLSGNQYEAVFTNTAGTLTSSAATLTVDVAPTVTTSPSATFVDAGGNATLTAAASGNPTPTVQWMVNSGTGYTDVTNGPITGGGSYSGATTAALTITGATATMNDYSYEAVFTNLVGAATSTPAELTVDYVVLSPGDQSVAAGGNASFTADSFRSTDTVQWEVNTGNGFNPVSNGGVYSGATSTTLNVTGVTGAMNGYQYEAVFTNSAGSFSSSPATLTVEGAPTITASPMAATVDVGGTATFTASASGNPAPNVLWMVNTGSGYADLTNTGVYSGVTTDTLTITGATAAMNGYTYEAVFTNNIGSTTTTAAALTVDHVTTQPANQQVTTGQNATFTAATSNPSGADTVQWDVNTGSGFSPVANGSVPGNTSSSYSGAATGTLTITAATTAMSGYTYEAVFTNTLGTITSNSATLSVGVAPAITTEPPASATVDAGGDVTFPTVATGTPTPTVQWKANTGNGVFSGLGLAAVYEDSAGDNTATTPTLQINGATPNMNGYVYEAVYSNSIGTATTTPVTLSVDSVATQPTNQTITAGQNVSFTASSTNSSDMVQWEVGTGGTFSPINNGGVYSGATTGTLIITNATTALDGQQYEAVFTNSAGSFATSPITLRVNAAGTSGPSGYSVTPNESAYSASNSNNASFTISSPSNDNGDTFTYTISSSRGGTPVTGSGTITSTSQTNSVNLQPLYDGTLTFSVTLTNSTGVAGAPATATVLKDTVSPGAFTVTPSLPSYNATTGQQFSFTITHAQVDSPPETYYWVLLLDGQPTGVGGNGQVTSSTVTSPPTDITSLPSGVYTLHVVDTNAAGDSNNNNAQFTLNRPVSTFSVTPDVPYINAAEATDAGFTIHGAEAATTCTYTVTDSNGKTIVSNAAISIFESTQNVIQVNVSSLADGTITYKVTLTDALGNTLTEQTTAVLDRVAPSGYSISGVPSVIGAAAVKSFSFTINSPASETNDTYAYTITSENAGFSGQPITGSGTITATSQSTAPVDITSLPDGPLSITIALTDQAGNVGATTAPLSPAPVLDTVLPSGYTITPDETVISSTAAEATAGFTINSPSAYASNNYTYTWSATDEVGNPPVAQAGPTGSGTLSSTSQHVAVDLSGLPDGVVTYSVQLTEPSSGNTGAAVTATTTLATSTPTFTVTPDEGLLNATSVQSAGFTIQNSNPGEGYSYTITDSTGATLATGSGSLPLVLPAAGYDVTPINLTSLTTPAAGTITFSVTLTDASGNMGTETGTAVYDPAAPTAIALSSSTATSAALDTANPSDPANVVGVLESISAQSGDSYTYSLVSGAGSTDNSSFTISGDQLLKSATYDGSTQSSFSILVQSTDALGNSIQQQFTITVGSDPIAATLSLSNNTAAANQSGAVVGSLTGGGTAIGNTINYSLVDEPAGGTNNNSLFTIVGNQLETLGPVAAGTYNVRVRMSSPFEITEVDDLPPSDVTGPLTFQMTFDPTQLPSAAYLAAAANAGLITLGTDGSGTGNWVPAVSANSENPGSLAQTNVISPYSTFWSSVTAAHPSATLANVVGSSGVDLANNAVWAVVDQPGEYAVTVTVFTEQVFTITVS